MDLTRAYTILFFIYIVPECNSPSMIIWECGSSDCMSKGGCPKGFESGGGGTDQLTNFIINLGGSTVYWGQGGDATITCDLRCSSAPPTWFHNGSIINFHSNPQVTVKNTKVNIVGPLYRSVLKLSSVTMSSSGTYMCQAPDNSQSSYQRLHITMGCPGGFFMSNGSSQCFKYFPGFVSWDVAKSICHTE
ncbi:unnamed protein product, partial [Meganyctiphanes norvegica]